MEAARRAQFGDQFRYRDDSSAPQLLPPDIEVTSASVSASISTAVLLAFTETYSISEMLVERRSNVVMERVLRAMDLPTPFHL